MGSTTLRVTTAAILVLLFAATLYFFGIDGFRGLVLVLVILMQHEYIQLFFKSTPKSTRFFIATLYFINFYLICFLPEFSLFWETLSLSFLVACICFMVRFRHLPHAEIVRLISSFVLGLFYVALLPTLVLQILNFQFGLFLLVLCFAVVFIGDIVAYFVGRAYGEKKIYPAISPNKSWAGALGGFLSAIPVTFIACYFCNLIPNTISNSMTYYLLLTLIAMGSQILAQFGDFFESLLKRSVDQKDSGTLLPGHGGFLDRFDALLFGLPLFYWFAKIL